MTRLPGSLLVGESILRTAWEGGIYSTPKSINIIKLTLSFKTKYFQKMLNFHTLIY